MDKFITDTKDKFQDLFEYLVSCGKSSKDPQGPIDITNVPGRVVVLGPPPGNLQGQGMVFEDHEQEKGQGQGLENESKPEEGIHDTIAQMSTPPGKRAPPRPKTG
ncbi:uncharacterized protein LOC132060937 [Lycium ferocissimum]|uniref:uncharacterized protein LOC132060937 n=1 Tax=Lycium ferocissimum TaxID=112874 RepID=UPI002815420E|nr:uncharacterized protein LOC132060937 [Lycium ferocissimum]